MKKKKIKRARTPISFWRSRTYHCATQTYHKKNLIYILHRVPIPKG